MYRFDFSVLIVYVCLQRHSNQYPVIAAMAHDYLGCSGSSAAPERIFSAAADVCAASRGSLVAITIERAVSTLIWLREGVSLGAEFMKLMEVCQMSEYSGYVKAQYMSRSSGT